MKIQYEGEKIKIIPKKYSVTKDVSRYFMSEKKRLTKEEREILEEKFNRQIFDGLVEGLKKDLSKIVSEYITRKAIPVEVNKILRWKQPCYFEVVFCRQGLNNARVVCPEKLYTVARKLKGIKTAEIKRGY